MNNFMLNILLGTKNKSQSVIQQQVVIESLLLQIELKGDKRI